MFSSNPLTHSYFVISISSTSSQIFHQCPHVYDQQHEIPTRPLETPLLLLIMTKNLTSADFYYPSHIYPFEAITS
jgi:hypothetical protein